MNRLSSRVVGAVSLAAWCIGAACASGQTLSPVAQDRSVRCFVIVPPCPPATQSRTVIASGFADFVESIIAERICDLAQGRAMASQNSAIRPTSLHAEGAAMSVGAAAPHTVIHAFSSSAFDVTFDLSADAEVQMTGILGVEGGLPVQVISSRVTLIDSANVVLFTRTLSSAPGGEPQSDVFADRRGLPAGRYRVVANAAAMMDASVPPGGAGEASFTMDLTASPPCRADLDGDGFLTGLDFDAFVEAYEDADDSADFDGDGFLTGLDFDAFVEAFEHGC